MKNATPSWAATSTRWKEASRGPRKPLVLGFFVVMVGMTSAVTISAQATDDPARNQQNVTDMPAHAPTIRAAKTSTKETISLLFDFVRQTNRRIIS